MWKGALAQDDAELNDDDDGYTASIDITSIFLQYHLLKEQQIH